MLQHENNDFFRKIVFLIPTSTVLYLGVRPTVEWTILHSAGFVRGMVRGHGGRGSIDVICTLEGEHMWACVAHSAPCVGLTN